MPRVACAARLRDVRDDPRSVLPARLTADIHVLTSATATTTAFLAAAGPAQPASVCKNTAASGLVKTNWSRPSGPPPARDPDTLVPTARGVRLAPFHYGPPAPRSAGPRCPPRATLVPHRQGEAVQTPAASCVTPTTRQSRDDTCLPSRRVAAPYVTYDDLRQRSVSLRARHRARLIGP